jgi:hypothetical protein
VRLIFSAIVLNAQYLPSPPLSLLSPILHLSMAHRCHRGDGRWMSTRVECVRFCMSRTKAKCGPSWSLCPKQLARLMHFATFAIRSRCVRLDSVLSFSIHLPCLVSTKISSSLLPFFVQTDFIVISGNVVTVIPVVPALKHPPCQPRLPHRPVATRYFATTSIFSLQGR